MLSYGNLIPSPEGDYSYTLSIRIINLQDDGLSFVDRIVINRTPSLELAIQMSLTEWSWHIRGEAESFTNKCQQAWDDLTLGEAPLMAKPAIGESFDLLKRFIAYLYTEEGFYIQPTCSFFAKMQQHFIYVLPPVDHLWHEPLKQVIEDLTSLRDSVQKHIDKVEPILKVQQTQEAA